MIDQPNEELHTGPSVLSSWYKCWDYSLFHRAQNCSGDDPNCCSKSALTKDSFPGDISERIVAIFRVATASRRAPGPFQHPIEWVPGTDVVVLKAAKRDTNCSTQLSTGVKIRGALFHASFTSSWSGSLPQVCLSCGTVISQLIAFPDCCTRSSPRE
jgi:hypothetical protein